MGRHHQRRTYSNSQSDSNNQHRPLDNPQQNYRRPQRTYYAANNHQPLPTTSQRPPTNNRSGINGTSSPFVPPPFRAESDLPGFSYDPVTKKYYAILPNLPGQPVGSTLRELKQIRDNFERAQQREQLERNHSDNKHLRSGESRDPRTPLFRRASSDDAPLPLMLSELSLGGGRRAVAFPASSAKRRIEERRMSALHQTPSYTFDVVDSNSSAQFAGCQFLDVREDGKTLIGCWSAGEFGAHGSHSRVVSYQVSVNPHEAQKNSRLRDQNSFTDGKALGNTYGLRFAPVENHIHVYSTLIDMAIAPADADVTCLLYATAHSYASSNSYFSMCTSFEIFLRPIDQLTREEGKESMTSPIYNVEWKTKDPVWSCSFNSNHMRIGIGMENCATIFNVLTEQSFKVSSGGRNVIAQQFSKEGDLLYLGRRIDDIWTLDLRMKNSHKVGEFPGSNSTCFIHQMEHRPNYILTDNFQGNIKLWDTRACRCVMNFAGHKNSSHKVPCFVDENERFLFAVGEDGVARGWSLGSGELLCSLVCPKSSPYENSDFPRLVYSDRWGGVSGNSALILAVNGDIHAHELLL